jgi:hypothetical protein
MCHFITAYVPGDADPSAVEGALTTHGLGFERIENRHIAAQIPARSVQILTTAGACDCGTALASAARPASPAPPGDGEVAKLRKKGWTESRIRRWLDEKATAGARREAAEHARRPSPGSETRRWVDAIRDVLGSGAAPWIGIVVHVYGGGLESERIELRPPAELRTADLTERALLEMEEDRLLVVRS